MAYIASEDYTAKRIYLHADTATANSLDLINVYLEHIIRRAANVNGERRFPRMVLSIGNESAGGIFTPQYVDLQNGVRLVPYNTSHAPLITPTPLISRAENLSGRDLFDRSSLTSGVEVDIDYRPEISGFKIVNVGGGFVDLDPVLSAISTLTDYHDNEIVYYALDNTTEVNQSEAVHVAVFDDSGISGGNRIKTLQGQNITGQPALLPMASRVVLV